MESGDLARPVESIGSTSARLCIAWFPASPAGRQAATPDTVRDWLAAGGGTRTNPGMWTCP
jgi:hypothetical protein